MAHSPRSCHYERSEESAFTSCGATVRRKQQIPHALNFTPTSAKTALVGAPVSTVRDDNSKSPDIRDKFDIGRTAPYSFLSPGISFSVNETSCETWSHESTRPRQRWSRTDRKST